jgi:hypothetical protein
MPRDRFVVKNRPMSAAKVGKFKPRGRRERTGLPPPTMWRGIGQPRCQGAS